MNLQTGPLCTRDSLAAELRTLGLRPGETLLVHSSLSSLGWVCGGAATVVTALLDVLGDTGTLVVPTHSGDNSDPADWGNPPVPEAWWAQIRASMPPFDARTTPTRGMGAVPEAVRTWPGAIRSGHPQTSFAALGPRAATLTDGHAPQCRLGERSPLARLEEAGARILLLGAGFDSCTAFHLAEYRVPGPEVDNSFAFMTPQGRRWTTVRDTPVSSDDFDALGADFEEDRPVVRGTVGGAEVRLFALAEAVAYAEGWLAAHRP
ncbi:AAC(3) family N-acetyltransferase (plasmid) [Streptomyces sp. NBC_00335]|uniref:aminoglycoside N(3)-acetyltransferase n=1 Tax=unclassified Streptomyces TaxID=2593676 RepID=UPI002254AEE9|nr:MULTISPECIES: AAC(3) family N-acetyltransferase [unclassified Streptomyces]MCX5410024.1 AAC(3) family N-acetyltransferase [Streptomyces sp. NBC_00086]